MANKEEMHRELSKDESYLISLMSRRGITMTEKDIKAATRVFKEITEMMGVSYDDVLWNVIHVIREVPEKEIRQNKITEINVIDRLQELIDKIDTIIQ